MAESIKALRAETIEGKPVARFCNLTLADLSDYDVLVDVAYSSLNYKDGLAITGTAKIARRLPLVLGIDLAGTVAESKNPDWRAGDKVIINGYGLSENENGGYAQKQRVKSEWLVRLPSAFSLSEAMAIGTAGYTAMLAVNALEEAGLGHGGAKGSSREVVVTGAAGGVGSTAVVLLAELGHRVVAVTGRPDTHDYLRSLGASDFIDRAAFLEKEIGRAHV